MDLIDIGAALNLSGKGGSGGSADTTLKAKLDVSESVGGVESGKSYAKGTQLEKIFRDMLDPVKYPTLTAPSATIAATGDKLLEKGAILNTTVTVSFNRGSINPAYGTSGKRAGEATGYSLNGGASQTSNTFSAEISESNANLKARVDYAAGEQPKDSTGKNYNNPLPAGSVESNTINYEFVNAMYANVNSISALSKLSFISMSVKQREMAFPAQTPENPEMFDVPEDWTITAVEVLNTLSNQWENAAGEFDISNTTHNDAAGNPVNYKRYTDNRGYAAGARKIRIKWA